MYYVRLGVHPHHPDIHYIPIPIHGETKKEGYYISSHARTTVQPNCVEDEQNLAVLYTTSESEEIHPIHRRITLCTPKPQETSQHGVESTTVLLEMEKKS